MLRHISLGTAPVFSNICNTAAKTSGGNPRSQRKLEARIKKAGALGTQLTTGKRGAYRITYYAWGGWDAGRDAMIEPGDLLPHKPWLGCFVHKLVSVGRGREDVTISVYPVLLVTHHALSRLAQRHDARTIFDLLDAAKEIWHAVAELADEKGFEECMKPPPAGWRTLIGDGRVVVLQKHERFHALIAATILNGEMVDEEAVA
jgi:hypothetical protein